MSTEVSSLLNLPGYTLIAAICGLILLEELGIPMPFAPGDLLLVIAGAAIASTHLNLLAVAGAVYVAAVTGAMAGREIFDRLGYAIRPRIARLPHAGPRIDALGSRLRNRGTIAVFVGRVTPGLRVVTTVSSGLVGLPRRTFAKGLLPGVGVYQAVFLGLGWWLGPAALSTVDRYAPNQGALVILAVAVFGLAWAAHSLAARLRALPTRRIEKREVQA